MQAVYKIPWFNSPVVAIQTVGGVQGSSRMKKNHYKIATIGMMISFSLRARSISLRWASPLGNSRRTKRTRPLKDNGSQPHVYTHIYIYTYIYIHIHVLGARIHIHIQDAYLFMHILSSYIKHIYIYINVHIHACIRCTYTHILDVCLIK